MCYDKDPDKGKEMTREEFVEKFYAIIKTHLDEKGLYPQPALSLCNDNSFIMTANACNPEDIYRNGLRDAKNNKMVVFGIDRNTKENQETTQDSVYTCLLLERDIATPFVVEYNSKTLETFPPNFSNSFWNNKILEEYKSFKSPTIVFKPKFDGKTYKRPPEIEDNIKNLYKSAIEDIKKDKNASLFLNNNFPCHVIEIDLAGKWLFEKLQKLNYPKSLINDACFVLGQRSFSSDPWVEALNVIESMESGNPQKPGIELANQLFKETFEIQ